MAITRNLFRRFEQQSQEVAATSVDTDASGDFTLTFDDLRVIESKADVTVHAEGGFQVSPRSVSGNTVTFRVFQYDYDAAADGAAIAHTSATDVTAVNATAKGH